MTPFRNSKRTSRRGYWPDNLPHSHSASPGFYNLHMPHRLDMTARIRMPRRSPGNHATVLFCLLSVLFFPRFLAAAEWSLAPVITLGVGADDNPALTTGPSDTNSFLFLSPRINWIRKTEISSVNLGMLLNATRYSGNDVEDTYSHALSLASFFQTSERTRWGLDGRLRRDTLFRTIRTTPDTGDLEDTDDALVERKVRRTWMSARPTWKYALSERSSLGLNYRITDVSFSNTEDTGLVDYQNHYLSTQYSHRITDRNDLNLVVNRLAYRPDGTGTKSDTTQLLVGVSHSYSETSRGRFLVGSGKTTQTTTAASEDTTNAVMEAGLVLRSELTTFDGVISRDVQASGIGRSVMSNQFRMYLARKISPVTSFVFRAKLLRNKALEGSDPGLDRRFYEVGPALSWQWRPEWAFGTEYRYRSKKFDVNPETAESNMLFMSATYFWPRQVASR